MLPSYFLRGNEKMEAFFPGEAKDLGFYLCMRNMYRSRLGRHGTRSFLTCVFLSVRKRSDSYWRLDYAAQPVDVI